MFGNLKRKTVLIKSLVSTVESDITLSKSRF